MTYEFIACRLSQAYAPATGLPPCPCYWSPCHRAPATGPPATVPLLPCPSNVLRYRAPATVHLLLCHTHLACMLCMYALQSACPQAFAAAWMVIPLVHPVWAHGTVTGARQLGGEDRFRSLVLQNTHESYMHSKHLTVSSQRSLTQSEHRLTQRRCQRYIMQCWYKSCLSKVLMSVHNV